MTELRFAPLFSGSSGNSIYVGSGDAHILVDAGLSGARIVGELKRIGVEPEMLSAILVTHEHSDHVQGVGVLSRKYNLDVYATPGTWEGMAQKIGKVEPKHCCMLTPGQDFYIGDISVMPFATPHDANEPVGLSFNCKGARFSIVTDVGCSRKSWMKHVKGATAVLLEANYDPDMLKAGSYPYELKRRILSTKGHLCNEDAGACALELVRSGTKQILLGHLSKENNFPQLALRCCEDALREGNVIPGEDVRIDVALRDGVTGLFGVSCGIE